MKKRIATASFALSLLILVSIVLQFAHSFRHINAFLSEKKCDHHYAFNKTIISHQHHQADHCFSCEFTFSNYLGTDLNGFTCSNVALDSLYTVFYSKEITHYFKGSLFQLRAPPRCVV